VKHQRKYTTKKIEWPDSARKLNLIPNEQVLKRLEGDYKNLSKTFLEPAENWGAIVQTLQDLNQSMKQL
jgi:hypothetical protein